MIVELLKGVFGGGGAVKSIESIASEWIQTDLEQAEAKTLMIKTLDPNGKMRRDLSRRVAALYTYYLILASLFWLAEAFGLGPMNGDVLAVALAAEKLGQGFEPITLLFGAIVTASFGVNYANVKGGN